MKDVLNLDILLKGSPILGKGGGGRETWIIERFRAIN
jgi:hypothetical protein